MNPTNAKKRAAAVGLALALALALPGATLAASVTQDAQETLNVAYTTTLTGVPATIDYGKALGGQTVQSATFPMTATTNDPNGLTVSWSATALASGGNSIPATAHSLLVPAFPSGCTPQGAFATTPIAPRAYTSGDMTICASSSATTLSFTGLRIDLAIPASQALGTYTGTVTFKVSER